MKDKEKYINVRVPPNLRKLINGFMETTGTYQNLSEFTRAALREKIQRDTPWLYEKLIKDAWDKRRPNGQLTPQ